MKQDERKALDWQIYSIDSGIGSDFSAAPATLFSSFQTHQGYRRQFLWISDEFHMGQL